MIEVPFDLELAKKINNKECNGNILTVDGNKVEFVYYNGTEPYPILGVIYVGSKILSSWFMINGYGFGDCRLKLEVPEYTTFKDGDVLANEDGDFIFILNTHEEYLTSLYAYLGRRGDLNIKDGLAADWNNTEHYRRATEEEKQKLINALKESEEPKAKEYLKRFFGIEEKPKYDFKPFDKVLVKYYEDNDWEASFFIKTITDDQDGSVKYKCLNGTVYIYCIPFEGNEHLL